MPLDKDLIKKVMDSKEAGGALTLHAYAATQYEKLTKETPEAERIRVGNNFFTTQVHLMKQVRAVIDGPPKPGEEGSIKDQDGMALHFVEKAEAAAKLAAGKPLGPNDASHKEYAEDFAKWMSDPKNVENIKKLESYMPYQPEKEKGKGESVSMETSGHLKPVLGTALPASFSQLMHS